MEHELIFTEETARRDFPELFIDNAAYQVDEDEYADDSDELPF